MREDTSEVLTGLTEEEARRRHVEGGPNAVEHRSRSGLIKLLAKQFSDPIILGLCAAAVLAGFLGDWGDTVAILAVVLLSAALGFYQEYRTGKALEALEKMAPVTARVRRMGKIRTVAARELVVGDVVILEAGDRVPADIRLHEVHGLQINEAALSGESVPVAKLSGHDLPVGGDVHLASAYKGTLVVSGRAVGMVGAIGIETQLGAIAELMLRQENVQTPLQIRMNRFAKQFSLVALVFCTAVFVMGLIRGESGLVIFMTALSLAVAAVPEALPAVVTVALAVGAKRMAGRNALVRRLSAVETLGSVTCICTDKTGTLTENRMRVERIFTKGRPFLPSEFSSKLRQVVDNPSEADSEVRFQMTALIHAMAVNNDAHPTASGHLEGDPTETALLEFVLQCGEDPLLLRKQKPRIHEFPFSALHRRMGTLHAVHEQNLFIVKGAPESVIPLCTRDVDDENDGILTVAEDMAEAGLRVLAFASRNHPQGHEKASQEHLEKGLRLLGLVGLADPPREGVETALAECRSAGIRVVMITGDHPRTAIAVASGLGLAQSFDRVLTGADLRALSDRDLADKIKTVSVFARVDPTDKIKIVEALQNAGEVVAMTGDGVNDAPALQRAQVGVAMGRGGTDVAREASDLVLLDDNFASIVEAVREGRRIYDNIRKFLRFVLAGNSAELWVIVAGPLFGMPLALLPIQILWINLVTDGLPGLALSVEKEESGLMSRPPRPPNEDLMSRGLWQHSLIMGVIMGGATLGLQWWGIQQNLFRDWQTMVFCAIALLQMGHVIAIRSETDSFWKRGLLRSPHVLIAALITVGLQFGAVHFSVVARFLKVHPMSGRLWGIVAAVSVLAFVATEMEKWVYRKILFNKKSQKKRLKEKPA